MTYMEIFLLIWIFNHLINEIAEIAAEPSLSLRGKINDWVSSVWNRFDMVSLLLTCMALGLRLHRQTFTWGRIAYAINTTVFYCRLFRIYHVSYHLGPKLVIFYRMISEVLVFLALLVIFILGYGIASQSLLHLSRNAFTLNSTSISNIMKDVLLTPYWQMYGELQLEEIAGEDEQVCHQKSCWVNEVCFKDNTSCTKELDCVCENPTDYSWVVNLMLFFYLIIGNIMLLNLLIAIFTYVFDEVQENSMEIWKFEMLRLIQEYDFKPALVPPFVVIEYLWRVCKYLWKLTCREEKENLEDDMKDTLESLRIFEKESIVTYLARINRAEECSIDNRVKRMSDKVDKIAQYIEQKGELEEIEDDPQWLLDEGQESKQNEAENVNHQSDTTEGQSDTTGQLVTQNQQSADKLAAKQHRQLPSDSPLSESLVNDVKDDDKMTDTEDEEEADDTLAEEVSDDDIERNLSPSQTKVAEGQLYSSRSRPSTSGMTQRQGKEYLTCLNNRLDYLNQQLHQTQETLNTVVNTIMTRFDEMEKNTRLCRTKHQ